MDYDDFDYGKAEADLYDSDCYDADEIYGFRSERGRDLFVREHGLNPDNYKTEGGSSGNSNNSNPCYLTTACVVARGLPDNCEELTILRSFRDTYLINKPGGKEDIHHYYDVAPRIVSEINARNDSAFIWNTLYKELVVPCVQMINRGESERAYHLYKTATEELEMIINKQVI